MILCGDALETLRTLPDASVNCCVTSPPYWGLRDYGTARWEGGDPTCNHKKVVDAVSAVASSTLGGGKKTTGHLQEGFKDVCLRCGARRIDAQLGLERTPEEYVGKMVEVFREVRRVLRDDGTLWLNLGDSYATTPTGNRGTKSGLNGADGAAYSTTLDRYTEAKTNRAAIPDGLKPKDLVGIPWLVARALQQPYYTGRIKAERDRVWLAAMLDAEGTICGFDHDRSDGGGHRSGVHIAMTNTSIALLDEMARIWPTSRSEHQRPTVGHLGTKTSWRWIVHGIENKQAVLREIYPYLIAKRRQAVVAYTLLELMANAKRLGHSPQKDATIAKRAILTRLLSDLNHQREAILPSWLIEPPSLFEPGWYLRSDVIWAKPNPMPESVTDRPTKAHEYVFLLAKSERYWYDAKAIEEPSIHAGKVVTLGEKSLSKGQANGANVHKSGNALVDSVMVKDHRNVRSVWTITTRPFKGAHFAVFPKELARRCILAGCPVGGTVLDPFFGSGTVGVVAKENGRDYIGIELNPEYVEMARNRVGGVPYTPALLQEVL